MSVLQAIRSHLWDMRRSSKRRPQNTVIHILFCVFLSSFLCGCQIPSEKPSEIDCIQIVRSHYHYASDATATVTDKAQIREILDLMDSMEFCPPKEGFENPEYVDGGGYDRIILMSNGVAVEKYTFLGWFFMSGLENEIFTKDGPWKFLTDESLNQVENLLESLAPFKSN